MKTKIIASLVKLKDWQKAMSAFKKGELDGLELRLDAFSDKDLSRLHRLVSLQKKLPPLLITVRSKKEGGLRHLTLSHRQARFKLFMPFATLLDCELSSKALLSWLKKEAKRYRKKLIVSYHNFQRTPSLRQLQRIAGRCFRHQPHLTKVAVHAKSAEDILSLLSFLSRFRKKGVVVIAMGTLGREFRIIFPYLGSRATFGHLGSQSAPGQLSIRELNRKLKHLL